MTAGAPHPANPRRPASAAARVRPGGVRREGLRRGIHSGHRRSRRRAPASDQLPLRVEGGALGGRRRAPLRTAGRHTGSRTCPRSSGTDDPGGARPQRSPRCCGGSCGSQQHTRSSTGSWCRRPPTTATGSAGWSNAMYALGTRPATWAWERLRDTGIAAPIDPANVHWLIVGAAWIAFVNTPEVRILAGTEPTDPRWVETHADGLVATFLPGLARAGRRSHVSTAVTRASPEVHRRATPARRHQLRGGGSGDEPDRDRRGLRRRPRGCAERPRPGVLRRPAALTRPTGRRRSSGPPA